MAPVRLFLQCLQNFHPLIFGNIMSSRSEVWQLLAGHEQGLISVACEAHLIARAGQMPRPRR